MMREPYEASQDILKASQELRCRLLATLFTQPEKRAVSAICEDATVDRRCTEYILLLGTDRESCSDEKSRGSTATDTEPARKT